MEFHKKERQQELTVRNLINFEFASNGCWEWAGSRLVSGYGRLQDNGKTIRAHKFFFERTHGPVPAGMMVCHKCDNRICVNPSHLFLGTAKDNKDDCCNKARHAHGAGNGMAKLTDELVIAIKAELAAATKSQAEIARQYGVSAVSISLIKRGKSWKHLAFMEIAA
ncbi:HNH endonuclease [Mesorhizobium sp. Root172]|uniref:HNH endonuclease n=1 Tax=Mesorhizobium sp. Root172 TaxID=1736481 RepID=UPI0006F61C75|nr:HNH endonuclease [Mesorhizobium sp. Root172]KRB22709.1 hypothetical protein ASE05_16135 [Mesorhizobium sp. Root172]